MTISNEWRRDDCSVQRALAILGERWTILVLREAFFGKRRFDEILDGVGCARNLLTDRLATLVEHAVLERLPYRDEGQRERFEYRLTERGRELFPILIALMQWGDRWVPAPSGPPIVVEHRDCGARVVAELRCADGHGALTARDTLARGKAARRGTKRAV
ncbi:MAG: helix-turn-helix transcriptional regulator [Deltaproteobacteria bacterium]|jgi:DNA-binding HxlR family transcriptional regulator|nr:helix-turn-helix transcriptional regulator [Deltaproteobacteria bacterium]